MGNNTKGFHWRCTCRDIRPLRGQNRYYKQCKSKQLAWYHIPLQGATFLAIRVATTGTASATSGEERIRAYRCNELFAKGACDPEHDAVCPPKASLNRILSTTPATINVTNREFL